MNDITRLSTQIEELEKRIKAISSNQSTTSNLISIKEYLMEMKDLLENLNSIVTTYTETTDIHETQIFDLLQRVASIESQLENFEAGNNQELEQEVLSLQMQTQQLQTMIQEIVGNSTSTLESLDADIALLQESISNNNSSQLQQQVDLNTQDISNIKGNSTTSLEVLENDISTLQTDVGTLEDEITDINTEISSINESIGSQNTTISNLQSTQNSMSSAHSNFSSNINSLNNRMSNAENNILNLSGGNISTSGLNIDDILPLNTFYSRYFYKIVPQGAQHQIDEIYFKRQFYFGTSYIFHLNYTSSGEGTIKFKLAYEVVTFCEFEIDLSKNPSDFYFEFNQDNFSTAENNFAIRLFLRTYVDNFQLNKIDLRINALGADLCCRSQLQDMYVFDGYYMNADIYNKKSSKVSLKKTTTFAQLFCLGGSFPFYNTANLDNFAPNQSLLPKFELDENQALIRNGYYLFCYGDSKLTILTLDDNAIVQNTQVGTTRFNYLQFGYTNDLKPFIMAMDSGGVLYYSTVEDFVTNNSLSMFKYNGVNYAVSHYNFSLVENFNLVTGGEPPRDYGFVAQDRSNNIVYRNSCINPTFSLSLPKGKHPHAYLRKDGSISVYMCTRPKVVSHYKIINNTYQFIEDIRDCDEITETKGYRRLFVCNGVKDMIYNNHDL